MAKAVAVSLISSRLDYANSLLNGTSVSNLTKLQRIQNYAAKLVLQQPTNRSSTALNCLHWLPVKHRINFKLLALTYKLLHSGTPSYLAHKLHVYIPARDLRSTDQDLLVQPHTSSVIGSRAFEVSAPSAWNQLPITIRHATTLLSFRRQLKSHLFTLPV